MSVRNPKTGKVLKNPERFIKRLQYELATTRESKNYFCSRINQFHGEILIRWNAHEQKQNTVNSDGLYPLNIGDRIAIVGKVVSVKGSKCRADNKESEIEYTVLETRRMPEDW